VLDNSHLRGLIGQHTATGSHRNGAQMDLGLAFHPLPLREVFSSGRMQTVECGSPQNGACEVKCSGVL